MNAQLIYDFESILPSATKTLFVAQGLTAIMIDDLPEFTKPRPRVEIVFKINGEASPKRLAILDDGSKRTSCFRGELKLVCITDADEAGKRNHSIYRSTVRAIIGNLAEQLNETYLQHHKVQFIVSGNEETGIRTQDNFEQTIFPFTVDISVQKDAWKLL